MPFPTPGSRGVNVFAQDIAPHENAYVFPPFVLAGPHLRFFDKYDFRLPLWSQNWLLYHTGGISFCHSGP